MAKSRKLPSYDYLRRLLVGAMLITILVLIVLIYKKVNKSSSSSPPVANVRMGAGVGLPLPNFAMMISYIDDSKIQGFIDGNTYTMKNIGLGTGTINNGAILVKSTPDTVTPLNYPLISSPSYPNALAFMMNGQLNALVPDVNAEPLYNKYVSYVNNNKGKTVAWLSIR